MRDNKGQITIFIILGIVIIVGLVFMFSIRKVDTDKHIGASAEVPLEVQPINTFIMSCLGKSAKEGVYHIGLQGGYYKPPEPYYDFFSLKIPYYYYLSDEKIPEKNVIEDELSNYIKDKFPRCIKDFKSFKEIGFEFDIGNLKVDSIFAKSDIKIYIDYPIKITKDQFSTNLDSFSQTVDLDFNQKYDIVRKILLEQKKDLNSVPLSYITSMAYKNEFIFELTYLDDNSVIFNYIFNETSLYEPFIYSYAVNYDWEISSQDQTFFIEAIPEFNINSEDDIIVYQVKVNKTNVIFYDYTDLFDINLETGIIDFSAYDIPNGKKRILIKAIDDLGNEAFAYMRININKPNKSPIIEQIEDQIAYVGQEFNYQVEATDPTNDYILFLDDTSLFNIHTSTGEIKFTPKLKGNYSIKITVVNSESHTFEFMKLEVR